MNAGSELSQPMLELRISTLKSSFLGETERRFAQTIAALEAMGPIVVHIDEDEIEGDFVDECDSCTMMRCTGALLSWLQNNPGRLAVRITRLGIGGADWARTSHQRRK